MPAQNCKLVITNLSFISFYLLYTKSFVSPWLYHAHSEKDSFQGQVSCQRIQLAWHVIWLYNITDIHCFDALCFMYSLMIGQLSFWYSTGLFGTCYYTLEWCLNTSALLQCVYKLYQMLSQSIKIKTSSLSYHNSIPKIAKHL